MLLDGRYHRVVNPYANFKRATSMMSHSSTFLRYASPNERRTISREDLGFYHAVVVGAIYELDKDIDVISARSFISPLQQCVLRHTYLSVVVNDKHTEQPAYEAVESVNLENHITILDNHEVSSEVEAMAIESALPSLLDRPWPADLPPWRIVVLPLRSPSAATVTRCLIAFAFSHTLGDGVVGLTFHRTFLQGLREAPDTNVQGSDSSVVTLPRNRTLPPPFDTPERLPISWGFLLRPLIAVYLPKFLANMLGIRAHAAQLEAGTWTGSPMFFDQTAPKQSRVKLLEIEAPLLQSALQASRRHDAKLTGLLHQLIVRALSRAIPDDNVTNFISGTAVDMRASIGTPAYTWGLFVCGHFEGHPRAAADATQPELSEEMWARASAMTKKLAECGAKLQDQAVGLLRYAPSIRNWTLAKLGQRRDCSYEVSNLLAFDGSGDETSPKHSKISKMVFVQPGNATSGAIVFNFVSVRGGSLVCAVSWQAGALGVPVAEEMEFVEGVCASIRADLEVLKER
ncbi:uncharacterized protein BO97DRAFT_474420 [Aspergillus homomorphus CBS 101889]|uniref:Alcohol acetyltransferase n=1 Tax=Aspergillus homomorphus (strain CBS 101889) TaxID=1450537 RepID=A0A395IE21_ASPHC|nr:hypothetical protein BO97DRAFT_474420 [Aspergillus homomorphus CBS 101889]RAL17398.1 hypothetical protein BO97DRAFT_474420 [Aspergillus homomorphus CBS 101889]